MNKALQSKLIGTWTLVSWFNETVAGERIYPMGKDATGYISYTDEGFVFVHIAAGGRALFNNPDPFTASDAASAAAFRSHITYAGRYLCHDDQVSHLVTQSSAPDWVGSEQIRDVQFTPGGLRLSAANAAFQGQSVTAVVDWIRAKT